MFKRVPRLYSFLLLSSISRERSVWTSTEKNCLQASPSLAAPAGSSTGPNTVACAQTSAAASPTSPKPLTWSLSVLTGPGSPGRCCGSRLASATSAAKTPTTSLPSWRVTMVTQKSWTNRWRSHSLPVGGSCLASLLLFSSAMIYICDAYDYVQGIFLSLFFLLEKSVYVSI